MLLRYAMYFSFWASALFALIYFEGFSPLLFLSKFQTTLTLYLTNIWVDFFDIPVQMRGEKMIFAHGLELLILHACNGMTPILLYTAALLAYPAKQNIKIEWMFYGYLILVTLNMMRIYLITLWMLENPEDFEFVHNFIARYVIAALTLTLFLLFSLKARVVAR